MISSILIGVMVVIALFQLITGFRQGSKMTKSFEIVDVNIHGFNMLNAAITFGACIMIIKFFLM